MLYEKMLSSEILHEKFKSRGILHGNNPLDYILHKIFCSKHNLTNGILNENILYNKLFYTKIWF